MINNLTSEQRCHYFTFVREVIAASPITERLGVAPAVILERIAMGGGRVEWYYCQDKHQIEVVERLLSPGSVVSFYFDDRIRKVSYSPEVLETMEEVVARTGEVNFGIPNEDGVHIDMEVIFGLDDLVETVSPVPWMSEVFYGEFPGRGNDGVSAVTVILPDVDGIVRAHPH